MEIPAKLVIRKMENELARLKESLDDSEGTGSSAAYREHAQALKTYCELLLDSGSSRLQPPANVRHASVNDVKARMSEGLADRKSDSRMGSSESRSSVNSSSSSSSTGKQKVDSRSETSARSKSHNETIYDEGDEPNSDSLFDF